jgi:hypothetical protein
LPATDATSLRLRPDDFSVGVRALGRLRRLHEVDDKTDEGVNFCELADRALLHVLRLQRRHLPG